MSYITDVLSRLQFVLSGKQISHRPDLAGRVHLSSGYADRMSVSIQDYSDYANVYEVYIWVHKAVHKTAEQIAPKRVRVVDDEGEEIENHQLAELLTRYNDSQDTIEDAWQSYITDMLLAGEAAFEVTDNSRGEPVEMWHRRPDMLHILPDEARTDLYPKPAGYSYGEDDTLIPPENLWHSRFYNPLNKWRGLAPIKAVREGITIDLFSQAWQKMLIKEGAWPPYALIAPEGITPTEKEDYVDQVMAKHSGVDGWHRPIVLENGIVDIKSLSLSPKDMEFLEQRKFSRDEVGAIFGMPDEIMGYGKDTYENFSTAWQVWWSLTLKPLIDHRDRSLQSFFSKVRPVLRPGEFIRTDLTDVGALQEDISPKVDIAEKLFRMGVPFNVLDERLGLGIGEVPGGDVGYVRIGNSSQQGDPQQMAIEPKKKDTAYQEALKDWQGKAQAIIKRSGQCNYVYVDDRIPVATSYKIAALIGNCKTQAEVKAIFSDLDIYLEVKLPLEDRDEVDAERIDIEDAFTPEIEDFLQGQVGRIIDVVRFEPKTPTGDFWTNENALLAAFLVPYVNQWTEASIAQQAGLLANVGLGIDANVNARAAEWAGQYALDLAKGLNATTKELAKVKIRNWIVSGQPLDALVDDLGAIISPRWRAELIASTEVTRAYAEAVEEVAREMDVVKTVVWQTARDERVCPICGPLQGEARKGSVFSSGHHRPPAHPRCRCWLVLDV